MLNQTKKHFKNRSEELQSSRQKLLENCYKEASEKTDDSFEITLLDGLENET
jgi:hypothetical protein